MTHILVAGKIHQSGIDLLDATSGITYDYVKDVSEESYAPLIDKADALVIRTQPLSAETIARGGNLKLVSRHGVGYDAVDLQALNDRGIVLTIVGDVNSVSVAEHSLMLIMSAAKRTSRASKSIKEGDWSWRNQLEAVELLNKRLFIIGFGRIGQHLARMASAFGMEIRACDPFLEKQGWPKNTAAVPCDMQSGLAWADIVSVNVPSSGRPILGDLEFSQMKRGVVLVNTARGGVVDEKALVKAIHAGIVAAAGIDVFEMEPPKTDNELLGLDQVILSPHIAGLTAEAGERTAVSAVQNVLDFFAGYLNPALIVNSKQINELTKS
ncbi:D-3-phosphoglycerate dehydrogenase [Cohaesibacter sp. ES.047]|uniref:hydroxyacid dehydrogenase n=1 Tax=Cohaesibacter sp. ES.047 TaxID=1798205 RepID=UPI000BB8F5D7|nr:hydroxyacid dehydrogenase [Cohaesibacter sp. ES.047]SNY90304.1 D-3-phosphoglycerate dehydrogenase [Cohaesibacter sp. ES.047]